jgi:hypothetical protein
MKDKIRADIFILIFFFSLFTLKTNAQKGYVFKIKYLPGHTYFAQNVTGIGLELTLNGDTADIRKLRSLGVDSSNISLYGGYVDSLTVKSVPLSADDKNFFTVKYSSNIIYAFLKANSYFEVL